MFISSGKPANNLRIASGLLSNIFVHNFWRYFSRWIIQVLSTTPATLYPQTSPLLFTLNHPCSSTLFTQFPQYLLLSTLINKKGL